MKTILNIFLLIIFFHTFSFADIIHVPTDTTSIQGGIDMANIGDTVLVDEGKYYENIIFDKAITVGSLFLTTKDKSFISNTVIDGGQNTTVVWVGGDSITVLCGFTITNGKGHHIGNADPDFDIGGGVTCINSSPTLSNLRITNNNSIYGGGLLCLGAKPKLIGLHISENQAKYGGGIWLGTFHNFLRGSHSESIPKFDPIDRCNIYNNHAQSNLGDDLRSENDSLIIMDVFVDTFSVLNPTSDYASPLNHFSFDILHEKGISAIETDSNQIPGKFSLFQNSPNPFNPSTTIKFQIQNSEFTTIEIYNIIGQKIQTLLNKSIPAGYHEVEFNGQNRSSGIYLYKIEAGEWSDVKKMIFLK